MSTAHLDEHRNCNQALVSGREILLATSALDIAARLQTELDLASRGALDSLLEGDDAANLAWIVEQLHRIAGVPFALVGELTGEDWDRVQTIELRTPAGRGDNFEYDLLGTPCSNVIGQSSCIYPAKVAELFPDDELLAQMGVESYVGLPLFDSGGRPLGLTILLDQVPWSQTQMQDTLGLLIAFRPRLEAILSNRRVRRDLELLGAQLELAPDADPLARLVGSFAHAMNVRAAFVSCAVDEAPGRMRTAVRIVDGQALPSVEYSLAGSPLAAVDSDGEVLLRGDLAQVWPAALELAGFPAQACLLLRLVGADDEVVGQLGLIHDRPLNERIGEHAVVGAYRRQIAFELRRQGIEAERLATERRMLELQRTESLGLLAGGVAHDFNNLLVGMLGNADLALLDWPEGGDARTRESLVDIRDAALSAMQLCRQMLAYAGQATVEPQRFELGAQIDELARLLGASISRTVEITVERLDPSAWVNGDLVQIRQIVMNLITNAGDAIGESRGRIRVTVDRVICGSGECLGVLGHALEPGNYTRLRVVDDGCGMDEETMARIFDPFFTTKQSGLGLGLAAMLGIVRGHSGGVHVDSTVGAGTSFTVYLPAAAGDPA